MKRKIVILILFGLITIAPVVIFAQPNPGTNSDGGAVGGGPIGGNAPIGGGAIILLLMAAGYGVKKLHSTGDKTPD